MSDEETVKLIQDGIDIKDNMELLYFQTKGYIRYFAKKYAGMADVEDLMQEGYIGLANAVNSYDSAKYEWFVDHLKFYLIRVFNKYLLENNESGKVSRNDNEYINRYLKIQKVFNKILNREPTMKEYVAYLRLSVEVIDKVRIIMNTRNIVSVDCEIGGEGNKNTYLDRMLSNGENIENNIISKMIEDDLKTGLWEIVKSNTSDEEYDVIYAIYKYDIPIERYSNDRGISRKSAANIRDRALGKLKTYGIKKMIIDRYEIDHNQELHSDAKHNMNTALPITGSVPIQNIDNELKYISYVLTATVDGISLLNPNQLQLALDHNLVNENYEIIANWEKPKPGLKPREVEQYDMQGLLIKRWDSASDASRKLKVDESTIRKCCRGTKKSAGGFQLKSVVIQGD